jgi:F-type H+-transporting ATPase subunit a
MDLVAHLNPSNLLAEGVPSTGWNIFWFSGIVILTIFAFATVARKGFKGPVFKSLPARLSEHLYLFLEGMSLNVIGPHGRKYVPLLLALWSFIFFSNVYSLVLPHAPTADWSLNVGLAIVTVFYVQYEGVRANGLLGHLAHFAGPKQAGIMVLISVILFPIEIVSEAMKMFSLSIRLFGNIEGGHIVIDALNNMIAFSGHTLPIGGLLLPIKFFTCVIQAYVFCILTCVYLGLVTGHDHSDGIGEDLHVDPNSGHLVAEHSAA